MNTCGGSTGGMVEVFRRRREKHATVIALLQILKVIHKLLFILLLKLKLLLLLLLLMLQFLLEIETKLIQPTRIEQEVVSEGGVVGYGIHHQPILRTSQRQPKIIWVHLRLYCHFLNEEIKKKRTKQPEKQPIQRSKPRNCCLI